MGPIAATQWFDVVDIDCSRAGIGSKGLVAVLAVLAYAGLKSRVVRHFDASLASKTANHDRQDH